MEILIADDHPLVRNALQQVISQSFGAAGVAAASSVAELQQQVEQ